MKPTKAQVKELKDLANQLPPLVLKHDNGSNVGVAYARDGRGFEKGSDKNKRKTYTTGVLPDQRALVNHQRRVRSAFEANGWEGVNAYVAKVITEFKTIKDEQDKQEKPAEQGRHSKTIDGGKSGHSTAGDGV